MLTDVPPDIVPELGVHYHHCSFNFSFIISSDSNVDFLAWSDNGVDRKADINGLGTGLGAIRVSLAVEPGRLDDPDEVV